MGAAAQVKSETIEDVVLRHSKRGMTVLRSYMSRDYCRQAARRILELEKGTILLTTGFYVAGHAETDGPLGTVVLAKALEKQGFYPVIITDEFCRGFFEAADLEVCYVDVEDGAEKYEALLEKFAPAALISIERCGRNVKNDYANMRGVSIKEYTARTDWLFIQARKQGIPTFGVGDGGNEIGMGNLKEVISGKLELVPCKVKVDTLVIATVSNWGAYAIAAYIQKMTGTKVLPGFSEIKEYLSLIVNMGSVDGVTKEQTLSVDGFSLDVEKEILDGLKTLAAV
ncbi:DUF4392 domain-containing protein [Claveliimonas bilis]|uniref:DUF4392 domain-containing protein n=1 Tax=Claveliimonas bilis TaxID=3028070 RepID=UPI001C3A54FD|nr:DUF4392 domain-containing protein [Claveliimonas bilis]HIZ60181.1 DUF4392 domain-containing protein [Candidatus Dorea faecipullorum]